MTRPSVSKALWARATAKKDRYVNGATRVPDNAETNHHSTEKVSRDSKVSGQISQYKRKICIDKTERMTKLQAK